MPRRSKANSSSLPKTHLCQSGQTPLLAGYKNFPVSHKLKLSSVVVVVDVVVVDVVVGVVVVVVVVEVVVVVDVIVVVEVVVVFLLLVLGKGVKGRRR